MGLFNKFLTRKNRTNKALSEPLPPTPHQAALLKKLAQEITSLVETRKTHATQFSSSIMQQKPGNYFIPYETPAIQYLLDLLDALKKDPNPFFFNEAYATFLRTKNEFVRENRNIFPKRKNSIPLINGVLRRMRQYAARLNNTNNLNVSPRPSRHSIGSFSNTESNASSLPSLQSLRINTRNLAAAENATRRQRERVNRGIQPPEEE